MAKREWEEIDPNDPEYLNEFYKAFGAGQSLTGRSAVQLGRSLKATKERKLKEAADLQESPEPQQEPDSALLLSYWSSEARSL